MDGGHAFDGLEPLGDKIEDNHHGARRYEGEEDARGDASLLDDVDWDCGVFTHLELDECEDSKEDSCHDEKEWNSPVGPGVCFSSPLQG